MSVPRSGGVVIDAMIFSWLTEEDDDPITDAYRAMGSRSVVLAFQTVLELRYGALHAGGVSSAHNAWSAPSRDSRSPSPTT